MSGLTAKQEGAVVDHVVKGMTKSDAYRQNYNTENMTSKSVNEKASELFANDKVSARAAELQAQNKKRLEVTVDSQIAEYRSLMEEARCLLSEEGNTTPQSIDLRIKVLARMDKIVGLENHKQEMDHSSADGSMTPPPSKIELVAPE